jgi:protein gp37
MSDLFQDAVPDEIISQIWSVMRNARWHTFQILTKRPERMRELLSQPNFRLPNVWLGTSVENSSYLDRLDVLRLVPASVRFVSFEPLLGPIDLVNLTASIGLLSAAKVVQERARWHGNGSRLSGLSARIRTWRSFSNSGVAPIRADKAVCLMAGLGTIIR